MKKWIFAGLFFAAVAVCFVGCQPQQQQVQQGQEEKKSSELNGGPLLLSVDFEPNKTLVYNFVSERTMNVNLDPTGKYSKGKQGGKEQTQTEKLEMQIAYKPIKLDPYGISIIEANCLSAKVTRSGSSRIKETTDAVESLKGKSFTLKITPSGKIVDYSSLENVSKELAEKAFGGGETKRGKVKNPDMVMDFLATQWNIWDSTASIKNPLKGLNSKSKWSTKLAAPMPFVSKIGRNAEYRLSGVKKTGNETLAEITSTYSLSGTPSNITLPYSGSFQMKGMFGFLQGYKVISIDGKGTQLFDVNRGLIKSDTQNYEAKVSAAIFGLGKDDLTPNIKIDQTITMTLVE